MYELKLRLYNALIGHEIRAVGKPNRTFRNLTASLDFVTAMPLDLSRIGGFNPECLDLFSSGSLEVGEFKHSSYWEFVRGGNQKVWYRPQGELLPGIAGLFRKRVDTVFEELRKDDRVTLYRGDELAINAVKRPHDFFVILKVTDISPVAPRGLNVNEETETTDPLTST